MTVTIDSHSGFCFGVTRAINTAESELQNGALCCLGDIVHNGQEVARLDSLGLRTIDYDDLRSLPSHSRVLLRAHGEPPSTYWIAQQRNIEVIDATCPVVKKLQDRIRECYNAHRNDEALPPQIVIYGQPGHAEVIGLQGQTNNTAIVIESVEQLDRIDFSRPIYLFSQTPAVIPINGRTTALLTQKDNAVVPLRNLYRINRPGEMRHLVIRISASPGVREEHRTALIPKAAASAVEINRFRLQRQHSGQRNY